jgi:hypothetical protein
MPTFARSNPNTSTASNQGTPGGIKAGGLRPGMKLMVGEEAYLWLLVFIEVGILAAMRQKLRRHHGG